MPTAVAQLVDQGLLHALGRAGDDDRVEGRLLGPALLAGASPAAAASTGQPPRQSAASRWIGLQTFMASRWSADPGTPAALDLQIHFPGPLIRGHPELGRFLHRNARIIDGGDFESDQMGACSELAAGRTHGESRGAD
jgi:hypothetical protein